MGVSRRICRAGFVVGMVALALGLGFAVGSALVAGDWYLARQPWIGIGLDLIVAGLAVTALFALALDVVEPVGWWRLLGVPPALPLAFSWAFLVLVGAPTTGFGGPERNVGTVLYSSPSMLVLFIVLTMLVALPLPVARLARRVLPARAITKENP
jgi:hypothetical protein